MIFPYNLEFEFNLGSLPDNHVRGVIAALALLATLALSALAAVLAVTEIVASAVALASS